MLLETKFTDARRDFTALYNRVYADALPTIVKRHRDEEIVLVKRELQEAILQAFCFRPEVINEADGSLTIAIDELELVVNQDDREAAILDLINEIKIYAQEYQQRMQVFLNAPNRKNHLPYLMRIWLCNSDMIFVNYWGYKYAANLRTIEEIL